MSIVRFNFFKTLLSSDGHPFKVLQHSIDVQSCRSMERTIKAAERRFERAHDGHHWKLFADEIEVDPRSTALSGSGSSIHT
jgi:hypothetical protein